MTCHTFPHATETLRYAQGDNRGTLHRHTEHNIVILNEVKNLVALLECSRQVNRTSQ
jgi:hypothetical protein